MPDTLTDAEIGYEEPKLLSDADIGYEEPKLLSDEDIGYKQPPAGKPTPPLSPTVVAPGAYMPPSPGGLLGPIRVLSGILGRAQERVGASALEAGRQLLTGQQLIRQPETRALIPIGTPRAPIEAGAEIRMETPDEAQTRETIKPGVPIIPTWSREPSDMERMISQSSTPGNVLMLGAGATRLGARALLPVFLSQLPPALADDAKAILGGDATPEEKRDRVNNLVLQAGIVLRGMKPKVTTADIREWERPLGPEQTGRLLATLKSAVPSPEAQAVGAATEAGAEIEGEPTTKLSPEAEAALQETLKAPKEPTAPKAPTVKPAPAKFAYIQPSLAAGFPDMEFWNLTEDIPGHAKGSSVTRQTLEKAGYQVPARPAAPTAGAEEPAPEAPRGTMTYIAADGRRYSIAGTREDFQKAKRDAAKIGGTVEWSEEPPPPPAPAAAPPAPTPAPAPDLEALDKSAMESVSTLNVAMANLKKAQAALDVGEDTPEAHAAKTRRVIEATDAARTAMEDATAKLKALNEAQQKASGPSAPALTPPAPPAPAAEPPAPTPVELPAIVKSALQRSDRDSGWVWMHANAEERAAVDKWLVETKHPSAQEPGTPEGRFRTLVDEQRKAKPAERPQPPPAAGPGARTASAEEPAPIEELNRRLQAAPPAGVPETLTARQRIADAWAQGKSAFSRAAANMRVVSETLKETWRGVRTPKDIDARLGQFDFLVQKSSAQSRLTKRTMLAQFRNRITRSAIAIYNDAGGDIGAIQALLHDLPAGTKPWVRRALEAATRLSPEARQFAADIDAFFHSRAAEAIDAGVFREALEDYYTHIWERPANMPDKLRAAISSGKVNEYFRFARQRSLHTILDGIREGLTPVLDPADVIPYYNYLLDRAIASRKFIRELSDTVEADGRPTVAPTGTARIIPASEAGKSGAMLIKPKVSNAALQGYEMVNHPAMRKWRWAGKDERGNPIFYESDLAVHPDAWQRLRRMMDRGVLTPTQWGRAALRASSEVKAFKLSAVPSLFHLVHTGTHELWHWSNPIKALRTPINWESPEVRYAVEKGHLNLAPSPAELHIAAEGILGTGLVHKIPIMGPISKAFSEWMFGEAIPRMKMQTFRDALARNQRWYAGKLSPDEIGARVGDTVNNAFGELNHLFLGKYGRDPRFQRLLRGIFLAPDFGEARLRFAEKSATRFGNEERLAFATMIGTMYLGARVANMMTHGDAEIDPKRAFSVKMGNHWLSMRSVAGDILHAVTDFPQFLYVRLNPLYSRTISDFFTQRDPRGQKLFWSDILLKRPAQQLIPIQFGNLTREDQRLWESFIGSMGLTATREVPGFEVSKMVRAYMASSDDPKLKAMATRLDQELFAPSEYRNLRRALRDDDLLKARDEYDRLSDAGKKPTDVMKAMRPFTVDKYGQRHAKAFGPLSQADWKKFRAGLTEEGQKSLAAAEQERQNVWDNFRRMQTIR